MKRERSASPPRRSIRIRHETEGKQGISRHDNVPVEMFLEVANQLPLPHYLTVLGRWAQVCRRARDAVSPRLALPDWLREWDLEMKGWNYYQHAIRRNLRAMRNVFVALYLCEPVRALIKWDLTQSMANSRWNLFHDMGSSWAKAKAVAMNLRYRKITVTIRIKTRASGTLDVHIWVSTVSGRDLINLDCDIRNYTSTICGINRVNLPTTPEAEAELWDVEPEWII